MDLRGREREKKMDLRELETKERNDLIIRASMELIQNVMPTNILNYLDDYSSEESAEDTIDDFDESRFFYELLKHKQRKKIQLKLPKRNTVNGNATQSMISRNGVKSSSKLITRGPNPLAMRRSTRSQLNLTKLERSFEKEVEDDADEMFGRNVEDDDADGSISVGSAASLTLAEIDELEMLSQLNVKPEDIQVIMTKIFYARISNTKNHKYP